ncbi:MAG: hypothetical protein ACO2PP_00025 [Thermocrinis sp.]|jgi:hypothetical protein|uniref:hypothetical protein n=1 Tax=Thermocrinis sp. TaxID=2024383 RepID=UPI003C122EA0
MAVSPEDLAAGALALQTFIKNAKYVEMVVDVAFGVIPSILGLGAAGLLASGISNTLREIRSSLSLLKTVGPGIQAGWMAWKVRRETAERWLQSDSKLKQYGAFPLAPVLFIKSRLKKNQDTQGKQEEQGSGGGGGGGSPPTPPDIKADKKEQNNEAEKPKRVEPSYGFSNSPLGLLLKRKDK